MLEADVPGRALDRPTVTSQDMRLIEDGTGWRSARLAACRASSAGNGVLVRVRRGNQADTTTKMGEERRCDQPQHATRAGRASRYERAIEHQSMARSWVRIREEERVVALSDRSVQRAAVRPM